MSTDLPAPIVPAEVDLRDFAFMPLDVVRLRDSDLAALEPPEACWAAVLLWCASWHQVPAASIPDDDRVLANLAGFGRVVREWQKVRDGALRGWVLCSDGRLYHPVVAEKALDAWRSKLEQRWRTECGRIKKHNQRHNLSLQPPEFEAWIAAGCPQGQPLPVPEDKSSLSPGTHPVCPRDVPRETRSKGQGEGQGQGQGQGLEKSNTEDLRSSVDDESPTDGRPALTLVEPQPDLPDCPHQELIALYAKHLPHLRQPARWDGDRAEAMRTRWRECSKPTSFGDGYRTKADGIAFWERFFAYVASMPKLRDGIHSRENGQIRVWKPDLPWLVTRGNFLKVIEGAYAP
jgi:hypothetical protein